MMEMESLPQVLVISDAEHKVNNCSVYDAKDGTLIATFKEGNSVRNGLAFIGEDYLISAFKDRPLLKIWTLSKRAPEDFKMPCPGNVSCLTITNCGMYCIAGINKAIYVWETVTGALLSIIQHHSQTITCLRCSSDGSHFLSGSKDGMVLVWLISKTVAANDSADNIRPHFTWMDHAAEVTDIHVGSLSIYARVATSSKDMTCRIYELDTGLLLHTVHVDYEITAVVMDESEYFLFLGLAEGKIYRINLFSVYEADVHYSKEDAKCSFNGHTKAIKSLSISLSGKYLVSGSEDGACKMWDMSNFTIVKTFLCNGPVTNAFITLMPPGLRSENRFCPRFSLSAFKRHYEPSDESFFAKVRTQELSLFHLGSPNDYFDQQTLNSSEKYQEAVNRSSVSATHLQIINEQMYASALNDVVSELPENDIDSPVDSD